MRWKTPAGSFLIAAALVAIGCLSLDIRLAEFVAETAGPDFLLSHKVSDIPDILFVLVCVATALGWAGHLYLTRKGATAADPDFFEYIGCAVPCAFFLKYIAKYLIGRTNTRVWLMSPDQYGFHWFHGGGGYTSFPSGHMAVFTVLMLGISRYFPQLRHACIGSLFCLGLALIATEYHYFSDIVAGAYLGVLVDLLTFRGLSFFHRSKSPTS